MSINPYQNIQASSEYQVYEFYSAGKDNLKKRVKFDLVDDIDQIYNLALCTVLPDGSEDCETASRNGDMDTVLETVAHIALIYTDRFPKRKIFFRGSDAVRSRKYQIGISRHLDMVMKDFIIEGITIDDRNRTFLQEFFKLGKNYTGFIFTRK